LPRQIHVFRRRLPAFFDKSMQRDQHAVVKTKQDTRFALARQGSTHFPQASTQRAAQRQSNRPAKLHLGDVATDLPLIFAGQFVQPLAYRFAACA
jgi:hypothetical protein